MWGVIPPYTWTLKEINDITERIHIFIKEKGMDSGVDVVVPYYSYTIQHGRVETFAVVTLPKKKRLLFHLVRGELILASSKGSYLPGKK